MRALRDYATPVSVLILAGVMLFDHFTQPTIPAPAPTLDGQSLGKAYAPALVTTYADAWIAAAQSLEEGKSVADSQKALQDAWKDGRTKAFKAKVEPSLAQILPAGQEPSDPAKRAQVAALWRAFASGLRAGH